MDKDLLNDLIEYFENKADADGDSEGIYPNKEMQLLTRIRDETPSQEDGWISVEKELPKSDGLYLAYVVEHPFLGPPKVAKVCYYGFGIDEDLTEMQWSFAMKNIKVTHWQPLPQPPIK